MQVFADLVGFEWLHPIDEHGPGQKSWKGRVNPAVHTVFGKEGQEIKAKRKAKFEELQANLAASGRQFRHGRRPWRP